MEPIIKHINDKAAGKTIFILEWDPLAFVREQEYKKAPADALETALTITGSADNAQVLTTTLYLSQTWPESGPYIMKLVKRVVREPGVHQSSVNPNVTAWIEESKFLAEITGATNSIVAEVGAQFGWLGAALRSSPLDSGLAYCTPKLDTINKDESGVTFRIDFSFTEREGSSNKQWHKMFRNPVAVQDYPISSRPQLPTYTGLEIPLHIMAELVQQPRVFEFNGIVIIKGFSAMLVAVPIVQEGGILVWKYFYNIDGSYISYPSTGELTAEEVEANRLAARVVINDIQALRHIVDIK